MVHHTKLGAQFVNEKNVNIGLKGRRVRNGDGGYRKENHLESPLPRAFFPLRRPECLKRLALIACLLQLHVSQGFLIPQNVAFGSTSKTKYAHLPTYLCAAETQFSNTGSVRTVAAAMASVRPSKVKTPNNTTPSADISPSPKRGGTKRRISKTLMQATIENVIGEQIASNNKRNNGNMPIGILGDAVEVGPQPMREISRGPIPGTPLVYPNSKRCDGLKSDTMAVRVATPSDDFDIAHLRLSVFSDFSPEVRAHFCHRSCQVLNSRRMLGATCLVATIPRKNEMEVGDDFVLGSAECSFHEFHGTRLGISRPEDSALYITEVAVNPVARRIGVGKKLLQGIDKLAALRGTESIYLHVDITNIAALRLYEGAGYQQLDGRSPYYEEFTTSLNLHDGATNGRKHHLLCKHLTSTPTWFPALEEEEEEEQNCLGFELQ